MPRPWRVSADRGQLRIAYAQDGHYPQYAALHLRDSYLRLNHGPGASWGTSAILMPVFWTGGLCHHGARVRADWAEEGGRMVLRLHGWIGPLEVRLRVALEPPTTQGIAAWVEGRALGDVRLDRRPAEAFKPVMLSSMRVSSTLWDAQYAVAGGQPLAIPAAGWIAAGRPLLPAPVTRSLSLEGGTSNWKADAPSIAVELDREMAVAGWVTPSHDPNDDNVGLWPASDSPLPAWRYRLTATRHGD